MTKPRDVLAYVSGPYSAITDAQVDLNITTARVVAASLWEKGFAVICPHMNTAHMDRHTTGVSYDDFLAGDIRMLRDCDVLVLVPGWDRSRGAQMEVDAAKRFGIPVVEYLTMTMDPKAYKTKGQNDDV